MDNHAKTAAILGMGQYLPPRVVSNFDMLGMMETSIEYIVNGTGVLYRRYADPEVSATDLAVPACEAAVADAGLDMKDIDFLIMSTITPDHDDPTTACFLHEKLGMTGIGALDIRQQCAGFVYGLSIADHFVRAGTYRHILLVCSEVVSKRVDGSREGRNIAVLLGDGAGAVVVGPAEDGKRRIASTILHADGSGAKSLYTAAPGCALGRMERITKEDIDSGRIHFRMDGQAMFKHGSSRMAEAIVESLKANHLTRDDVDLLIPHQANLRMVRAVGKRTRFPKEKVFVNVQEYGNMASATLPVGLVQAREQGLVRDGATVLMVAFGSGFVWGSALLTNM